MGSADPRLIPSSIKDASTMALNELIDRMGTLDITPLLIYMVDNTITQALPHLAEQFHVTGREGSALCDTADQLRELIKNSIPIHRKKGTPWAIKQALATIGYPGSTIIEHRENHAAWLAAGGEFLDGVGDLSFGDLSAPGRAFSFTTSHWAEYAIRLNIGDAVWTTARRGEIMAMAMEYAPARCRLAAVIIFAQLTWNISILMAPPVAHIKTRIDHFHVPHFDTLDGGEMIGGWDVVDLLDGSDRLDGDGVISGARPDGDPLNGGLWGLRMNMKVRLPLVASGGNRMEPAETLNDGNLLDGRGQLSGPVLDGIDHLDGGDLYYPILGHPDNYLDGSSRLGCIPGLDVIWFNDSMRLKSRTIVTAMDNRFGMRMAMSQRHGFTAGGGDGIEPVEYLDGGYYLDGRGVISGTLLDGRNRIDGGDDLSYPLLGDPETMLDGKGTLGFQPGADSIWFAGVMRIKQGINHYTEVI